MRNAAPLAVMKVSYYWPCVRGFRCVRRFVKHGGAIHQILKLSVTFSIIENYENSVYGNPGLICGCVESAS